MGEFEKWWEELARGPLKHVTEYDLSRAAWQAATAAERARCGKVALAEKVGANERDDKADRWHDMACDRIAAAIRKG